MHQDEDGQGLVEFVLLVPMLVLLVYATWYFSELVRERIRVQQAARYAAFASAHSALTNYNGSTLPVTIPLLQAKTSDYTVQNLRVNAEVTRMFGDIVTPIPGPIGHVVNGVLNNTITQRLRQKPNTFFEDPTAIHYDMWATPYFPVASLGELKAMLGNGTDFGETGDIINEVLSVAFGALLNNYGFGGAGMVHANAGVKVRNKLVPLQLIAGSVDGPFASADARSRDAIRALAAFELREKVSLVGDSWTYGDGRELTAGGMLKVGENNQESGMHKEVDHIKFVYKAVIPGPYQDALDGVLNALAFTGEVLENVGGNFNQPYGTYGAGKVISRQSRDKKIGEIDVFTESNIDPPNKQMNTRREYPTAGIDQKALDIRGDHWMGCRDAQRGTCDYRPH